MQCAPIAWMHISPASCKLQLYVLGLAQNSDKYLSWVSQDLTTGPMECFKICFLQGQIRFSTHTTPLGNFPTLSNIYVGISACVPTHAVDFSNIWQHVQRNFLMCSFAQDGIVQHFPKCIEVLSTVFTHAAQDFSTFPHV